MSKSQPRNIYSFYPLTRAWAIVYLLSLLLIRAEWIPPTYSFLFILVVGIPLTVLVAVELSVYQPGRKLALWLVLSGVAWWFASASLVRGEFDWHLWHPVNTVALLMVAYSIGLWLAGEIEHAGHLLPVCILGALVDIWSVFQGPSKHVGEEITQHVERQISTGVWQPPPIIEFLVLHWPQPGVDFMAPLFGFGDLVFIAFFLGGSRKFGISVVKTFWLLIAGLATALIVVFVVEVPIPALPFICGFFILGNFKKLSLTKKEWAVTIWIVAVMIVVGLINYLKSGSQGN